MGYRTCSALNPSKTFNIFDKRLFWLLNPYLNDNDENQTGNKAVLSDMFNFGKRRTLKQAVGLFLFYAALFFAVFIVISVLGEII